MESNEIFSNIVRPLNPKHIVRAILAFVLNEAGELISHEDGDTEELKALKARVRAKLKGRKPATPAEPGEGETDGGQAAGEGEE